MTVQPGMMIDPGQDELLRCGPLRSMPPVTPYFDTTAFVRFPKPDQLRTMLDSGHMGWFVPFCEWNKAQLLTRVAGADSVLDYLSSHRRVPVTWMIPDFLKNVPLKLESLSEVLEADDTEFSRVRKYLTMMQNANVTPRGLFLNGESLDPAEATTPEQDEIRRVLWEARIDQLECLAGFQCAPEHSCVYGYRLPEWFKETYPLHPWFRLGHRRYAPMCVYPYWGDAGIDTPEKAYSQLGRFVAGYAGCGVHNFNTMTSSGLGYMGEMRLDGMIGLCRALYHAGTWKLWLYLGNRGAGNGIIAAMLALNSSQEFETIIREGENWVPQQKQARGWYADPKVRTCWVGTDADGNFLPGDVWICCRIWNGLAAWFGVSSSSPAPASVRVLGPDREPVNVSVAPRGEWTLTRLHGGAQ